MRMTRYKNCILILLLSCITIGAAQKWSDPYTCMSLIRNSALHLPTTGHYLAPLPSYLDMKCQLDAQNSLTLGNSLAAAFTSSVFPTPGALQPNRNSRRNYHSSNGIHVNTLSKQKELSITYNRKKSGSGALSKCHIECPTGTMTVELKLNYPECL